jgi:hypothetical protein
LSAEHARLVRAEYKRSVHACPLESCDLIYARLVGGAFVMVRTDKSHDESLVDEALSS